ncbi:MAG: D-alanyl-D-alanine carboxypeptidase family protein [Ruminococcus sp.]
MESRNMSEKEFEEFQKLLERELGEVDSEKEKEEQEITEMLRHEGQAHESVRNAGKSVGELNMNRAAAVNSAERAQKNAEAQAMLRAERESARASSQPSQMPHGKYEKVTEEPSVHEAPKADELIRKPGKYEKRTGEEEGYFNPELPKESAAERRRRARRNAKITRIVIGFAAIFVLSLSVGLIVNSVKSKKQDPVSDQPVMQTDIDGNVIEGSAGDGTVCNIINITPMDTSVTVLEGGAVPLQISMTTSGIADQNDITWESSDPSVAEVTADGTVKGISAGKCSITIAAKADPEISAQVSCTVRKMEKKDGVTYIDGILIINKTYGVDADYAPGDLTEETRTAFDELCSAAAADGLNIYLASGYRSYDIQNTIFNNYTYLYGQDLAETFSARPGHSEHQSGLAIDVNTVTDDFAQTPEAQWLEEHCAEYGFIIRYAADKVDITGYKYEPWHIRYVGRDIAKEITELGVSLEEYLGVDSVYADDETQEGTTEPTE